MEPTRAKKPWTKGEKFLLSTILITVLLASLGYFWWAHASADPLVSVPAPPPMPAQNAFNDFTAAGASEVQAPAVDYAISSRHPNAPPASDPLDHPYSLAEKIALVQANAKALKMLRQGLAHPYQPPPVRSFSTLSPQFSQFRKLARLIRLASQVKAERGDWGGAVRSHLDSVQMGEMLPHGSTEIGMLVGIACQAIGRDALWPEVDHLSAAQARAAARRLEAIAARHVPLADVMQEEEWADQAGLLEIFRDPHWPSGLKSLIAGDGNGIGLTRPQQAQMLFVSKRAVMGNYTAYMDRAVRNARQPYAARPPAPPMPSDPFSQMLIFDFGGARLRDADNETQNALLTAALALRAYRLERGAYPATLKSLVPAYLSHAPGDPFALAGPLRYKRQGAKYLLYSVGRDGKDDGGRPVFDASKSAPMAGEHDKRYFITEDSRGDVVAGVNIF